jgi:hypothetical protein
LSSLIPSIRLQTDKDAGHDDDELDEHRPNDLANVLRRPVESATQSGRLQGIRSI